jgi:hypothetical protein
MLMLSPSHRSFHNMGGSKWSSVDIEVEVIARYDRLEYHKKSLSITMPQEAGTRRWLASVRSKLAELRLDP